MTGNELKSYLNRLQVDDNGKLGTLRHMAFIIDGNAYNEGKKISKERLVSILKDYYCTPNRFEQLWNRLNDAERKVVSLSMWFGGYAPAEYADDIAKEYGISERKTEQFYFCYIDSTIEKFKEKYASKKSALWLLFPSYYQHSIFHSELNEKVGKMKRIYSNVSDVPEFSTRESRTTDFAGILRFCNSNKVTITKSGIPSKSSALKIKEYCGYEELAAETNTNLEDVRAADGLLVTFPLTMLCNIGGILAISENCCIPGSKAMSLIALSHEELVKKLFDVYLKNKSFDEISIIKGIKQKRGHNPAAARQNLVEELKHCSPGQWLSGKEFERNLRMIDGTFARKSGDRVVSVGSGYYESTVSWTEYEKQLIKIIFSFFAALGIIDIVWDENTSANGLKRRRFPLAFRINPLGEYVLGLTGSYDAPEKAKEDIRGGFTVLPDYTIIIPDSSSRKKHEVYFENLFTKVSETEEVVIYKLDFQTVVRAINSGSRIADLRKYLSGADKPVPENITRALDDWEEQAGRIRLRQVTILECDDAPLLEEVIRYKGMGELVQEKVCAAVVVDGTATGKIKKIIEKNKRFCKDVL